MPGDGSHGNKVLLSGDGPDKVFGGYNRWMTYLQFPRRGTGTGLPRAGRRAVGAAARPFAARAVEATLPAAPTRPRAVRREPPLPRRRSPALPGPGRRAAALRERPPETAVRRASRAVRRACRHGGDQLAWMSYVALKTELVEDYLCRLDTMAMGESGRGTSAAARHRTSCDSGCRFLRVAKVGWSQFEQKALFRQAVSTACCRDYITEPGRSRAFDRPWGSGRLAYSTRRIPRESLLFEEGLVDADAVERPHREGIEQRVVCALDARDAHGLVRDEPVIRALLSRRAEGDR